MSTPSTRSDRHYTYADYLKFPADQRWEVIDGVAYSMSPAPSFEHQALSGELHVQIGSQLRGRLCRVIAAPFDVRFEDSERTDKVVQPDLLVVCRATKAALRARCNPN